MQTLSDFLNASQARHSHLCPRQVLGVRVALAGLDLLNIEPALKRRKGFVVISETDGCFVDGIEVTAQVSVGHRSLKIKDYGKIAATFVDIKTRRAVRVHPVSDAREIAREYVRSEKRAYFAQLKGYQTIPDSELLNVEWVILNQDIYKILGSPRQRGRCLQCGEEIINGREIVEGELTLCMACAGDAYYYLQYDVAKSKTKIMPLKDAAIGKF
jgi:formylmethanofuran dehydrogenase subunit E